MQYFLLSAKWHLIVLPLILVVAFSAAAQAQNRPTEVETHLSTFDSRAHFPAMVPVVEHRFDPNVSAEVDPYFLDNPMAVLSHTPRGGFAVPAYSTTGYAVVGYVTLDATDPASMTVVAPDQANNIYAGTFIGDDFSKHYVLTSGGGDLAPHQFGTIDTATGEFDVIGTISGVSDPTWSSLMWDHTNNTLYAVNAVAGNNRLYTIDPDAMEATLVGTITGPGVAEDAIVITAAISPSGHMYAIDIRDDVFLAIDKETAEAAMIGLLGFDANFAQDMDFDGETGILYWAAYGGGGNSQIMTVDLESGSVTPVGPVPGGSELLSFTVAKGSTTATEPEIEVSPLSLTFNVDTDELVVTHDLTISNVAGSGAMDLEWNVVSGAVTTTVRGVACENDGPEWLTVTPNSGTTAPGESDVAVVQVDGEGLEKGIYEIDLCVESNDPMNPIVFVAVTVDVRTVSDEPTAVPIEFALGQNFPNPFAEMTTIEFALPEVGPVTIEVYDVVGRLVTTLVDGEMAAGHHSTIWNANGVAPGVYLYRIQAGSFTKTLRTTIVR